MNLWALSLKGFDLSMMKLDIEENWSADFSSGPDQRNQLKINPDIVQLHSAHRVKLVKIPFTFCSLKLQKDQQYRENISYESGQGTHICGCQLLYIHLFPF